MVLPFAMVDEMGWWAIPITTLVVFTLYGIDGIASELEDPFGVDRLDIDVGALVEDIRTEVMVELDDWKRMGVSYDGASMQDDQGAQWWTEWQDTERQSRSGAVSFQD